MIKKILPLLLFLSFHHQFAIAEQPSSMQILPSYDSLMQLPHEKQIMFIQGIRELLIEFEEAQKNEAGIVLAEQNDSSIWALFLNAAEALNEGDSCIHAGFLMKYKKTGGRLICDRPSSIGCVPSDNIQCNPIIFGSGVCSQHSQSITKSCDRNAKSLGAVIEELKTKKSEWNEFAKSMSEFCKNSRRWECSIVMGRMLEIDKALGTKFTAEMSGKMWDDLPVSATAEGKKLSPKANPTSPAKADEPACAVKSSCSHAELMDLFSESIFNVPEIQSLLCSLDPMPQKKLVKFKQKAQIQLAKIQQSNSDHLKLDKCYLKRKLENIDLCTTEAELLRKSGKPVSLQKIGSLSEKNMTIGNTSSPSTVSLSRQIAFYELRTGKILSFCQFEYKPEITDDRSGNSAGKTTK